MSDLPGVFDILTRRRTALSCKAVPKASDIQVTFRQVKYLLICHNPVFKLMGCFISFGAAFSLKTSSSVSQEWLKSAAFLLGELQAPGP